MPKKYPKTYVDHIVFVCGKCGEHFHRSTDEISILASESDCETCQSTHGYIKVSDVVCPYCKYKSDIELRSW